MACFLVPTTEAIITTIVKKNVKAKEAGSESASAVCGKISFSKKLGWLNNMLWGGSALLAFEHVWHGEVTPWFPFLTAAGSPEDLMGMLHEMATVGVSMSALVTLVWVGMVVVSDAMGRKLRKSQSDPN